MKHTLSEIVPVTTSNIVHSAQETVFATALVPGEPAEYWLNPWLGLIGLAVLVVTGAVAVIREIQIEEEEVS